MEGPACPLQKGTTTPNATIVCPDAPVGTRVGPDSGFQTTVTQINKRRSEERLFKNARNGINSNQMFINNNNNANMQTNMLPEERHFLSAILQINVERKNTVVNLSSRALTPSEESLLTKGLNFCPTPGEQLLAQKHDDLENFHNKLRWKSFFLNHELSADNFSSAISRCKVFRPEKPPRAPPGSSHLETFATINEIELNRSRPFNPAKQNLTRSERESIRSLMLDKSITIKPADKGGAVVVMNTSDYVIEAERQLSDTKYYREVGTDLSDHHTIRVNNYLEGLAHRGQINHKALNRLITTKSRSPHFYLLPKIHKGKTPPPGRPIVSANGCAMEKISALTDLILRPLVPNIPSYIKDTGHFLQLVRNLGNDIPENTLLCTLDVSSLYTNIPNEDGRRAVAYWLSKHRPSTEVLIGKPSNQSILSLLQMVLEFNNFQFNGKHYLQVGGTAMGTRVAPTLANMFMGNLERQHVYTGL